MYAQLLGMYQVTKPYLQCIIRGARYEAIPEPLVSWLPQDIAQLAVQVLEKVTQTRQ